MTEIGGGIAGSGGAGSILAKLTGRSVGGPPTEANGELSPASKVVFPPSAGAAGGETGIPWREGGGWAEGGCPVRDGRRRTRGAGDGYSQGELYLD